MMLIRGLEGSGLGFVVLSGLRLTHTTTDWLRMVFYLIEPTAEEPDLVETHFRVVYH